MILTPEEHLFYSKYEKMKTAAGSHAPSVYQLLKECPQNKINIDACFLCNPYAFDLFMTHFYKSNIERYLKFYPPQNHEIAKNISAFTGIPPQRIIVGNGAIEIIQSFFGNLAGKKIAITMPTFSAYYEIAGMRNTIIPYFLDKNTNFDIEVEHYIDFLVKNKPDIIVVVNPNNPTGTLIKKEDLVRIHENISCSQMLIVDESFIQFSNNNETLEGYSLAYDNIIIIRSLSKDFGIAGIRLGYAVMTEKLVQNFRKTGYLWNSNGLAYHFTELLRNPDFINGYNLARLMYIRSRDTFFDELKKQESIMVYPSAGNFCMVETKCGATEFFSKLVCQHGIYTRILNDKLGLNGNFIRIASKSRLENGNIVNAIKALTQPNYRFS